MISFIRKLFGEYNFDPVLKNINSLELELEKLSDEELKIKSKELKEKVKESGTEEKFLPEAFALIREAAKRTLKQRHFNVQLIGGMVLNEGKIAEMATGEGKTLVATAPAYFNALTGKGVHVVTVNDYLAKRDAVWMGQIYQALGVSVSCLTHDKAYLYDSTYNSQTADYGLQQQEKIVDSSLNAEDKDKERDTLGGFKVVSDFLRPISRKEAYRADIVYGTNHEFGFDYLRDNLAYRKEEQVQNGHFYAIIDEVDSILIDEARTPLIIAAPDIESSDYYKVFAKVASGLIKEEDYAVDEKSKTVSINDSGIAKVEKILNVKNIYAPENFQLVHYMEESLKAVALFHRDKQYVIKNGEVIIVDEFTGRLMPGRRYAGGLHQAIEAKEGVKIQQESRTFAQITIQNYFRLYEKISGMTGTAQTSAEEFHKVYNLEVITIPTNKPIIRKNLNDLIYKNTKAKYEAIVEEVRKRYIEGQPVLLGTSSIEKNEIISNLLKRSGIPHEVLNAKNHEREGEIIAQAGRLKAVTVATNMAGRGVDIILGGNPPDDLEAQKVKELGGVHVLGTDRHEARRIDNQLRGRSGRQGDPGSSQFILSLEDDLIRVFGGDRVKNFMETMNIPEDQAIESGLVSKVVNEAQKKIEGLNFDLRKHLLEYDDVLNKQRTLIYIKRQEILEGNILEKIDKIIENSWPRLSAQFTEKEALEKFVLEIEAAGKDEFEDNEENFARYLKEKIRKIIDSSKESMMQTRLLAMIDRLWMNHLENLEDLRDSVGIRAYGQHDPLIEYRQESYQLFQNLLINFEDWVFTDIWRYLSQINADNKQMTADNIRVNPNQSEFGKVGRNDPCPCGSGKKYKKCHGA